METVTIGKNEAGQRLDKYLKKYLDQAPAGFLYRMLRKKNILLNGKRASGSEKLALDDQVTLYLARETIENFQGKKQEKLPEGKAPYQVVYEDENIMVINKPAGMLSQKADPKDVSLNEYLIGYLLESGQMAPESLAGFTPGVCNRLDRNTSGLVIGAKTLAAAQEIGRLLKERCAGKYYLALVKGRVTRKERIRGWLTKDETKNRARISREPLENGAPIETAYEPLAAKEDMTLLKVELITGKTHQIRSHLAGIGHPLAGDRKYGDAAFNRYFRENYGLNSQFLHSWQIEFPVMEPPLEGVSQKTITAKPPKLFQKILQAEKLSAGGK